LNDRRTDGFYALLFIIIIIIVVGAWLRLRNLSSDSIWFDEAASWLQSKGSLADLISATANDNYPPLHNLLLFASMHVSGTDTEWVLRLPSALLGTANIAAIYWLGTLIGGRIVGLVAATLLATSGFHIHYSQEARMYSLLALAATLYAAAAFLLVQSPTALRAVLITACGLALVYSHPFGTLNWAAIGAGISTSILLTSGFGSRGFVLWLSANAAVAVAFLPWAAILLQRAQAIAGDFWLPYPSVGYVYGQVQRLMGGGLAGAALMVAAAIGFRANPRAAGVLLAWIVVPIVAALTVSLVSTTHIFLGRYLIGQLPALMALAALGIARLASGQERLSRVAAAALVAVTAVGSLASAPRQRDDWRTVAAHLSTRVRDADCILVYPAYQVAALQYYLRRPFCAVLPNSIADIDVQRMVASRLFVLVVAEPRDSSEVALLREKMRALGREGERLDARRISVVEYQLRP
jgi:mannosyltransferase